MDPVHAPSGKYSPEEFNQITAEVNENDHRADQDPSALNAAGPHAAPIAARQRFRRRYSGALI
jgi:hypothetical protein